MTIQRETDANPILRDWSSATLPDDVIRRHARPASARDYLDWRSCATNCPLPGNSLKTAGDLAADNCQLEFALVACGL